jgi:hypothetical protein
MQLSCGGAVVALMLMAGGAPGMAQRPPATAFEPQIEKPENFPDFAGRDEAFGFCSACHAFRLVAAQGMTRQQWETSLVWMTDKHAMPALERVDRDVIVDYLAKAFPPRASSDGGGWRNPFTPTQ